MQDPEYERRLEDLPEYQRSIEIRYPSICANCLPTVEAEIRKRDQEARVRALGGALKSSKGTDTRRRSAATQKEKDKLESQLRMWKLRGSLWMISVACALAAYTSSEQSPTSLACGFLIGSSLTSRCILSSYLPTERHTHRSFCAHHHLNIVDSVGPDVCNGPEIPISRQDCAGTWQETTQRMSSELIIC